MSVERFSVKVVRDLVYSRTGGQERLADLFLPMRAGKIPVIVWVHGGGWRFGDRKLGPDFTRWMAERGFAMVSFDYRLSDEAKFPAQAFDLKTVVRWVRSVAEEYGLDAEAIGLWGSSAGGHLAAIAALSGEEQFTSEEHAGYASTVNCVVDAYGPTDFARIDADRVAAPPKVADAETVLVKGVLPAAHAESFESRLIGVPVGESEREVRFASPLRYVRSGAPPFLILHGESDALVPWTQSSFLYEALREAGNEAYLVLFERFGHGFLNNSDLDATETGATTVRNSRTGGEPVVGKKLECFALCERFFRYCLEGVEESGAVFAP